MRAGLNECLCCTFTFYRRPTTRSNRPRRFTRRRRLNASVRAQHLAYARNLVLHCPKGGDPRLDALVEDFIKDGIAFVGVVGKDCSRVEDIIDELVVGDRFCDYELLTSRHDGESLGDAIAFAKALTGEFAGEVQVVEL